jgi:uncharacterized membrane protein
MPPQSSARPPLFVAFALLLGLTVVMLEIDAIDYAYERIGVDSRWIFSLLAASLIGSGVNVPLRRLGGSPGTLLAINLGGALIPSGLSIFLLAQHAPLLPALAATLVVGVIVHRLARPVPGVGVTVPILVPPFIAALAGIALAPSAAPCVAYIAGTFGTLIGADLTNLSRFAASGAPVASIGGAGTFDSVFVTGILAVLLA